MCHLRFKPVTSNTTFLSLEHNSCLFLCYLLEAHRKEVFTGYQSEAYVNESVSNLLAH